MSEEKKYLNFLEQIVEDDLSNGFDSKNLRFRFPPEPNGYLHIGHTKAIGISFGLGIKYNAPVNLRFDDTNPAKEEQEYVDAIKEDITWLGYTWDKECYSSDYFQQLYDWTVLLIQNGKAYVDSQSSDEIASQKGTTTEPGTNSPFRNRSIEDNLELFSRMKNGEFNEGSHVVRAKIDMSDPNMLMRDPLMYRIMKKTHHRTADDWCIYPMYDWTHGESDFIEEISHSLCSLEFKPHRKLYDWFLDQLSITTIRPKQREFARLNLNYTIMSKRKLLKLVNEKFVSGWDDPRMPTISGLRRRGFTPASIRNFIDTVGVAKRENIIDVSLLEFCIREDLNKTANRVMGVLDPVKLTISNYDATHTELLIAENNPEDPNSGHREVPFSKELYIEREDFKEEFNSKFFRLSIGKEVRLKNAYIIKGESVIKDSNGIIQEIHCTYDPKSKSGSGSPESKRNVKGTLHWVSIPHAVKAEVRIYDRLFTIPSPDSDKDKDFTAFINPDSLKVKTAFVEPSLKNANHLDQFQFQRLGYFNVDNDSKPDGLVFNKTVGLRDSWSKPKNNESKKPVLKTTREILPIDEIKRAGKKYTNLPDAKRELLKSKIQEYAKSVTLDDLQPMFNTAVKKTGTRVVTLIALDIVLSKQSDKLDEDTIAFILKAKDDSNELLSSEAILLSDRYSL